MLQKHVVIAGAGIAGSYLAILMSKKGYKVTLLEKLSKKDVISANSKRSYNLTLYGYGLRMLKEVGLWNEIKSLVIPLAGAVTYLPTPHKEITSLTDSKKAPYFAISRAKLLSVLLEKAASNKNVKVLFSSTLLSASKSEKTATYRSSASTSTVISCDLLVGCDGVNSKVREFILKNTKGNLIKEYSNWVYQQIPLEVTKVKLLRMKSDFAYTWSSNIAIVASFPNKDASSTAMLIYPEGKRPTFRIIKKLFPVLELAEKEFDVATPCPEGRFVTVHSTNWFYKDFMVILGDAAHGFNPFFGQGISAAMGDCELLVQSLDTNPDVSFALEQFVEKRKLHMDALGELSKEGFKRYRRHKTADFDVIYDKLESLLHQYLPKYFAPSIFESISQNPGFAHTYLQKRISQRNMLNMFGMSAVVRLVILILDVKENFSQVKLPATLPPVGKSVLKAN